ncbi:MAG: hypothetical protein ACXABO_07930 [Promethearchaeota archaeon]
MFQDHAAILGKEIYIGRQNPFDAPWASLFPGLAIFGMMFSFLILYVGLQGQGLSNKRSNNLIEPNLASENPSPLEER